MKNNYLKLISVYFIFICSFANSVELNSLNKKDNASMQMKIIKLFDNDSKSSSTVENIKQLDNSKNYMFKYKDENNYYTMMYMQDINAVLIQSTGEIFSFDTKTFVTKDFNSIFVKNIMSDIKNENLITYYGIDKLKSKDVYVFTDPTCGYCQKLHREIKEYQNNNINIHYMPFPRAGLSGLGYEQLVNIECSVDKKSALTKSKTEHIIPKLPETITKLQLDQCKKIVKKYYDMGTIMGVKGTPAMFTKDGKQLGGYVPADQLKLLLF